MSDDGNGAVFVGTFLANGDTVALCQECLPSFAVALAANLHEVPIDGLADAINNMQGRVTDDPAAAGAEVAAPPHQASHGAPTDEPPGPAPADTDDQADQTGPSVGAEPPPDSAAQAEADAA